MTDTNRKIDKNVYFFDVEAKFKRKTDQGYVYDEVSIDTILKKIRDLDLSDEDDKTSILKTRSGGLCVSIFDDTEDVVLGQIASIREAAFPKGLREGEIFPLRLNGIKLYEPAHFVYYRNSQIIVIEWNSHAPRNAGLAYYLKTIAKKYGIQCSDVKIKNRIAGDAADKLNQRGLVDSIVFKIGLDVEIKEIPGNDISSVLNMYHENGSKSRFKSISARLETTQEVGDDNNVKREILEVWATMPEIFEVFSISTEGDGAHALDFINDKLYAPISVACDENGHIISEDMYTSLHNAYMSKFG